MDSTTEANGSRTSVLPPAVPPGRRAGVGDGPQETFLPPPAGRAAFRQRFIDVGTGAVDDEGPHGPTVVGVTEAAGAGASAPSGATGATTAPDETGPLPEWTPRLADPDLAQLRALLSDLVEDLDDRGEAALEIRDGLPSFQVTLRAYCRGYLDGRRGAREG